MVGHLSPTVAWHHLQGSLGAGAMGVCSRSLGVLLLGGGPGRTAMAAIAFSTAAGLAIRTCSWFLGDKPDAHLLVVMQGSGQHKGLFQALPTAIADIVVHYDDDMVEVQKVFPPLHRCKGGRMIVLVFDLSQRSTWRRCKHMAMCSSLNIETAVTESALCARIR